MPRVTTYGDDFSPVPFKIAHIREGELRLPRGAGRPIHTACMHNGFVGSAEIIFQAAQELGVPATDLGWVFPVTSAKFTGRLWWEWAMLDGTLSRTLHAERKLGSFEEGCVELLAAYQSPTTYGIKVGEHPDYEGPAKLG
jgi:hypothetical protein